MKKREKNSDELNEISGAYIYFTSIKIPPSLQEILLSTHLKVSVASTLTHLTAGVASTLTHLKADLASTMTHLTAGVAVTLTHLKAGELVP